MELKKLRDTFISSLKETLPNSLSAEFNGYYAVGADIIINDKKGYDIFRITIAKYCPSNDGNA